METSLLHFSVHSHVAQMSAIELTGADDVTQAEEVGTIPSEVIFSDNSQYAYVMRRSPTAGVDLLTAYAMNSETGQLSILQSDPANSLFNRLLFSGSNGFWRAGNDLPVLSSSDTFVP